MKRSGKFYFKNEKEVMKKLGLQPVPGSGSGWIHKEDGESDKVLVQLKSTDADSYRIQILDIQKLEYHAEVSNKVPIFLVQFLKQDKIYALVEVDNISELYEAFELNKKIESPAYIINTESHAVQRKTIKSSSKSRKQFYKEKEEKYGRRK